MSNIPRKIQWEQTIGEKLGKFTAKGKVEAGKKKAATRDAVGFARHTKKLAIPRV